MTLKWIKISDTMVVMAKFSYVGILGHQVPDFHKTFKISYINK